MIQYTRARRKTQTDLRFSNEEKKIEIGEEGEKIGRRRNQRATVIDRRYMASESANGSRRPAGNHDAPLLRPRTDPFQVVAAR